MGSVIVQDSRIKPLNQKSDRNGKYVLYWMQQSQRAEFNHALEFAIQQANQRDLPLLVCFALMDDYPEANVRHYRFMLEGLRETQQTLEQRGIKFMLQRGHPAKVPLQLSKDAALVVCDRGYLRHQKIWRAALANQADCHVVQVEADVVVPVEEVTDKAEFAARTIRPKIHRLLKNYLINLSPVRLKRTSLDLHGTSVDLGNIDTLLGTMKLDRTVPAVSCFFPGGTFQARKKLRQFLQRDFGPYAKTRNQPQTNHVSHISMHLHFGQISPLQIALAARECASHAESKKSFLEELIVRRELAQNFTEFTPNYDQYVSLPRWARQTLDDHRGDKRTSFYSREELDSAKTHDPYWNASMLEMKYTGYMHNAMRMYWGKKILEWTRTPEEGFQIALELNNRYFLDGRDPNGYANVAWIFGLHDRPWKERPIFGKVRYMNAAGLERKCDIHGYVQKVEKLVSKARANGIRFPGD
ncbi:MAG: deoxyribodipyrimidine photo-lyase [Verrucomicrobia bacterium]|nr:deoxyribodipyrimidine photo-lyase [Verrucomicrobiota bacterium]